MCYIPLPVYTGLFGREHPFGMRAVESGFLCVSEISEEKDPVVRSARTDGRQICVPVQDVDVGSDCSVGSRWIALLAKA